MWRGTVRKINAHKSVADRSSRSLSISVTSIMTTEWQNPSDADVILRTSGGKEFHAHKLVLSLASPVFRDMFSVPQPPAESSQTLIDTVGVDDPPEALDLFLQIIYPITNPPISDVETLASILRIADKYDAKVAPDIHKNYLPSMRGNSPLQTYAILCVSGDEKEAEAVVRRAPFASLTCPNSSSLFDLMTAVQYHRLVTFIIARDQRTREIVSRHREVIANENSYSCRDLAHQLYSGTIVTTLQAAFEADPCVRVAEALALVLSAPTTFSLCETGCRYGAIGLRKYAEGLLKELVEMAKDLPWAN
jgi:hypothetical protein